MANDEMVSEDSERCPEEPARGFGRGTNRRFLFRLLVALFAAAGLVIGGRYYLYARTHVSTDDAFIAGHIIPVSPRVAAHVVAVHVDDNEAVKAGDLLVELASEDFTAQVDAAQANLAAAQALYQSNEINVDLTTVTATSSNDEAQANLRAAQALVETAQGIMAAAASQRDQARAQLDSAKAALAQAEAEVDSAKAQQQRDSLDLKRLEKVVTSGADTQQRLDHASASEQMSAALVVSAEKKVQTQRAMIRQAEAGLKTAEDNLRQACAQVSARQAQAQESEARLNAARSAPQQVAKSRSLAQVSQADIDRAQAQVEQAKLNLSYTRIYAPADGVVTAKAVEPGAYVQVGQTLLAVVPRDIWVIANFKETQLTHMRPGQPAEVTVDAYPGVKFSGRVDSIQKGTGAAFSLLPPENATGNYVKVVQRVPVKIVFDNLAGQQDYLLAPGMSVVPEVNIRATGRQLATGGSGSPETALSARAKE